VTTARKLAATFAAPGADLDVVHELHRRIVALKREISKDSLAFGGALAEMRDHELYRALGYPTFEDYLVSAEVALHRSTAYSFMRIYQRFRAVQAEVADLDWNKLNILAQIIKEDDAPERILPLVEAARAIPRDELRERVRAGKEAGIIAPPSAQRDPWDDAPEPVPETVQAPALANNVPAAAHQLPLASEEVREYVVMRSYQQIVGVFLKLVQEHGEFFAHVPPGEVIAQATAADLARERAAAPVLDWFARLGHARRNRAGLRAVK
jgi:hypothetical protein